MFLLDVNLLIALADADHEHHLPAHRFFKQAMRQGWATCPLTENGFLRIIGHPNYPQGTGSPETARVLLRAYLESPGHQFWPDSISLSDERICPNLPPSKHLTDIYLLALAVHHGGRLASFDRRMNPAQVPGGAGAYYLVEP